MFNINYYFLVFKTSSILIKRFNRIELIHLLYILNIYLFCLISIHMFHLYNMNQLKNQWLKIFNREELLYCYTSIYIKR